MFTCQKFISLKVGVRVLFAVMGVVLRELSFFSSRGGRGEGEGVDTGLKTLLNSLSPLEAAEKLLTPLSVCVNFM